MLSLYVSVFSELVVSQEVYLYSTEMKGQECKGRLFPNIVCIQKSDQVIKGKLGGINSSYELEEVLFQFKGLEGMEMVFDVNSLKLVFFGIISVSHENTWIEKKLI